MRLQLVVRVPLEREGDFDEALGPNICARLDVAETTQLQRVLEDAIDAVVPGDPFVKVGKPRFTWTTAPTGAGVPIEPGEHYDQG